ncbi:MAG TPA: hypothetical protein VMU65_07910 [Candidatus Saccharimonadales bacterium]|nr:hypothetical protein [Candidatus Saccharimonadales bacterium]
MERMGHADQHRHYPEGTPVFALNGERLGRIRTVYSHLLLVEQDGTPHANLEVPTHAIATYDDGQLHLSVNREALSVVDDEESAARRLHTEGV